GSAIQAPQEWVCAAFSAHRPSAAGQNSGRDRHARNCEKAGEFELIIGAQWPAKRTGAQASSLAIFEKTDQAAAGTVALQSASLCGRTPRLVTRFAEVS